MSNVRALAGVVPDRSHGGKRSAAGEGTRPVRLLLNLPEQHQRLEMPLQKIQTRTDKSLLELAHCSGSR